MFSLRYVGCTIFTLFHRDWFPPCQAGTLCPGTILELLCVNPLTGCLHSLLKVYVAESFTRVFPRGRPAETDTPVPGRQPPREELVIRLLPYRDGLHPRRPTLSRRRTQGAQVWETTSCAPVGLCTLPARRSAGVAHLTASVVLRATGRTETTIQ